MKTITYFCILIFLVVACNTDTKTKNLQQESVNNTQKTPNNNKKNPVYEENKNNKKRDKKVDPKKIAQQRAQALGIINHRLKKEPETFAIVDNKTWEYEFVFSGKMSAAGAYKDVWIDFKRDHTYAYGKGKEVLGKGKYNYHFDRGEILMVDDQTDKKPQEWSAKFNEDVMIMVGTSTYNDNHTQQKLIRVEDFVSE